MLSFVVVVVVVVVLDVVAVAVVFHVHVVIEPYRGSATCFRVLHGRRN